MPAIGSVTINSSRLVTVDGFNPVDILSMGVVFSQKGDKGDSGLAPWVEFTGVIDPTLGTRFYISAIAPGFTIEAADGFAGQQIIIAIINASGAELSYDLDVKFRFGTDLTGITPVAVGKTDYITAVFNDLSQTWDVLGYTRGF